MILTLTLNPALDITWQVSSWRRGVSHRVTEITERPGGKGINVSRVLDQLGEQTVACGFLGGTTGGKVAALLKEIAPSITQEWVETEFETRRSVAIVDQDVTVFNESGFCPSLNDWQELRDMLSQLLPTANVLVIAGSMPGDTPSGTLAELAEIAHRQGVKTIIDTSGVFLLEAANYADLLKPNQEELFAATKTTSIEKGVEELFSVGATAVVVSKGKDGMEVWTPDGAWAASVGRNLVGNPTGAGDASSAAWAKTFTQWPPDSKILPADLICHGLIDAVATSAAAVVQPLAGEINLRLRQQLLKQIEIIQIN